MLVTFSCKFHENITLFGSVAKTLLNLMGHSGTVPGAILAEDVPDALRRLREGIAQSNKSNKESPEDQEESEVSLKNRAVPLIGLLQDAVKHHCNVMWDK